MDTLTPASHAERTPDAPALVMGTSGETVTTHALLRRVVLDYLAAHAAEVAAALALAGTSKEAAQ